MPEPNTPGRFDVIRSAPVLMTLAERVVLYSTIYGLRPQRCLEIGTHQGGSAVIIGAALDDIGQGRLACVDPSPVIRPETWARIAHRATLFTGGSPAVLPEARAAVGGPFDFALIDGDHATAGVVQDIEGILPLLAPHAYLLFHDAHYFQVRDGIDQMLRKYPKRLLDCGMVSVEQTPDYTGVSVTWGGLRLLKFSATRPSTRPRIMDYLRDSALQRKATAR